MNDDKAAEVLLSCLTSACKNNTVSIHF